MRLKTAVPPILALFAKLVAGDTYDPQYYNLVKDYQAGTPNFFNNFNFYSGADPKGGFVQ